MRFLRMSIIALATVGAFIAVAAFQPQAANAALHPCRNWDRSQLTTEKFRAALKANPQCAKVWTNLTKAPGGKFNPEQYVVRGKRNDMKPGQKIVNSGITDSAKTNYYKYTVKPGEIYVDIENTASAVVATAKSDCLNPAGKAPPSVVNSLPSMVTLKAWARAEATARAAVFVRVRTECPGSVTTVTVRVWVYAHSKAAALAKAKVEQASANAGHPSASVRASATATARVKLKISIVTTCKVVPVPVTPATPTTPVPPKAWVLKWWKVADGTFVSGKTLTVNIVRGGTPIASFTGLSSAIGQLVWTPTPVGALQLGDQLCEVIPAGTVLGDPVKFPQCQAVTVSGQGVIFYNKEVPPASPPTPPVQPPAPPPTPPAPPETPKCQPPTVGTWPDCRTPKGNNSPPQPTPPGVAGGGDTGQNPPNTPSSPSGTNPADGSSVPATGNTTEQANCPPGWHNVPGGCEPNP